MSQIGRGGKYNLKTLAAKAKEILDPLSSKPIDPYEIVERLPISSQQVVEIAKAISNNCRILILDEPTNGLDPIGIQELRSLIRSFPSKGITVILSSHILSEVQLIADDIGIISNGILGYEGQMNKDENLENLFVEVVRKSQEER